MITHKNGEPLLSIYFANFYCPAYNDKKYVDFSIHYAKEQGFNDLNLDTKETQDFRERFHGKDASQFVKMQEYTIKSPAFPAGLGRRCGDFFAGGKGALLYWNQVAHNVLLFGIG